jgi:hypothetical protein
MYKVEYSTLDYLIGTHVQFENDDVCVGDIIYLNRDEKLVVETVTVNTNAVIVTTGKEFIRLNKI